MTQYQGRSQRLTKRKKRKGELGNKQISPKLGDDERKSVRVRGGGKKVVAIRAKYANISDKGKTKKLAIMAVEDNPANKDFKRESVLSLGGIIETELGKARITSRPSQDGVVNAVLL